MMDDGWTSPSLASCIPITKESRPSPFHHERRSRQPLGISPMVSASVDTSPALAARLPVWPRYGLTMGSPSCVERPRCRRSADAAFKRRSFDDVWPMRSTLVATLLS